MIELDDEVREDQYEEPDRDEPNWLNMSENAFRESTDWIDANKRRQWERNISNFHSRHASGSKYSSDAYRGRSRLFVPKTRATERSNEASAAAAYFSTGDVLNIAAVDPKNPLQRVSANMHKELIDFRLKKTIPWFMTLMGAFQDAQVTGVCISHQWWEFLESEEGKILADKPRIDLIPVENFRFHPASSWVDPIGTSPYLIYQYPMTVGDVKSRMNGRMNGPQWKALSDGEISHGVVTEEDSTRLTREKNATGKHDTSAVNDFTPVWIHMNIMRHEGTDYVFWTIGTKHMLTDPVPLEEVFHHGMRPFTLGFTNIETHRTYPSAAVELGQDVQVAINDTVNQRIDNVSLVLNKRSWVKRGQNVDMRALSRSVPGGIVLMDDIDRSVKHEPTQDVTGSSYQEQDRLQMMFDDVSGAFSSATVQGSRALGETVGGMELMSDGTNAIKEYQLRIFNESWVEPTLRQLQALEALYETDEVVLKLAADAIELIDTLRNPQLMGIVLEQDLTLEISVGMGATNPQQRISKINQGLQILGPLLGPRINVDEISMEVWGALGYKDGKRFVKPAEEVEPPQAPVDPVKMAMAQVQQGLLNLKVEQFQFESQLAVQKLQAEFENKRVEHALRQAEIVGRRDVMIAQIASRENIALEQVRANFDSTSFDRELKQSELALKQAEIETNRQIAAIRERSKMAELQFKATSGREGI